MVLLSLRFALPEVLHRKREEAGFLTIPSEGRKEFSYNNFAVTHTTHPYANMRAARVLRFMWGQSLDRFVPSRKTTSAGQHSSLIGGKLEVGRGRSIGVESPSDALTVAEVRLCDLTEIDSAVRFARQRVVNCGSWSIGQRQQYLRAVAAAIRSQLDALSKADALSCGMCIQDARLSVESAAACFDTIANLLTPTWSTSVTPPLAPQVISPAFDAAAFVSTLTYCPVGVVALITPFNYPLEMFAWKAAPALAAGNAIIWKPPEAAPLSSFVMIDILQAVERDMSATGAVQVLQGDSAVGEALARHPHIDMVAFTGSIAVGKAIQVAAAKSNLKRVQLELGGNACAIASPSIFRASRATSPGAVDVDTLMDVAMQCFANSGQSCTSCRRLYVPKQFAAEFVEKLLRERLSKRKVGHALDSATEQGPLISASALDRALSTVTDASCRPGVSLVAGGFRPAFPAGYFLAPTVLYCTDPKATVVENELFAPVLCVVPFEGTTRDAAEMANNSIYGLSSVVVTSDPAEASELADALQTGTVWVNCVDKMDGATPFGGWKQSGYGRDLGVPSIQGYSNLKTITKRIGGWSAENSP